MYLGEICEIGEVDEVFNNPKHPYTRVLLSSIPKVNDKEFITEGIIEESSDLDSIKEDGCKFYERCTFRRDKCKVEKPSLKLISDDEKSSHKVACFFPINNLC